MVLLNLIYLFRYVNKVFTIPVGCWGSRRMLSISNAITFHPQMYLSNPPVICSANLIILSIDLFLNLLAPILVYPVLRYVALL